MTENSNANAENASVDESSPLCDVIIVPVRASLIIMLRSILITLIKFLLFFLLNIRLVIITINQKIMRPLMSLWQMTTLM